MCAQIVQEQIKAARPIEQFKSLHAKITLRWSEYSNKALDLFSDNFYGVRLLKPGSTKLGYVLLVITMYSASVFVPPSFIDAFSYINFTEQLLVLATVLLTVLLSAGFVFLGDDTRGWSLARLTIIEDVVKLKGLIISIIVIALISILPDYPIGSYTLKEAFTPILIASYIFIAGIFIRVYRWLSDLAADPSLFEVEDETESRLFPSSSYRFARIVYLIRHNNKRDAWQSILERKIPDGYEEFIHEEFFKSSNSMISSMRTDKLQELSLMLEIYDNYYSRRNLDSWRFHLDYTKRFLILYASVYEILRVTRPREVKLAVLWRGQSALERIINRLVSTSMNSEKIWNMFEAMDEYAKVGKLLKLQSGRIKDTKILKHFIEEFLEAVFKDEISGYDIRSYVHDKGSWQITYKTLYEDKNNISWVLFKHFEEWLFAKLDRRNDDEDLIGIDQVIELIFPEVDPIDFAKLYWFKYNAKNTTDYKSVVDAIYQNNRPFGHIGRSSDIELVEDDDDKEDLTKKHIEWYSMQREAGYKLFANTQANYFNSLWSIDKIITAAGKKVANTKEDDRGALQVKILIEDLKAIKRIQQAAQKK